MKKILVAVIILSASVTAFAGIKEEKAANAKFKVTTDLTAKTANLTFIPSGEEKVIVRILDANGTVIFQEQLRAGDAFSRPYNMSNLDAADYTIVVKEGENIYSEKVSLTATISTSHKASFSAQANIMTDGKVVLKVLQTTVSPVVVSIKDQKANVLYSTTINNEASFLQKFDISKIKGNIYFEIESSNGSKTIEL